MSNDLRHRTDGSAWLHPSSMVVLFGAVLMLMLVTVAAIHWRHWRDLVMPSRPVPTAIVATGADRESAHFTLCNSRSRYDCVVDGDTIHYHGDKIRIADINAPEVSEPACDSELDLGEKATDRLLALLNEGRFSLGKLPDRDTDVYNRKLRTISRGGISPGAVLVKEGLAEK